MAQQPFLLKVIGIPHIPSITEINIRSGPGTNFMLIFKIPVGTTDIPMDSFHKVWILPKDALVYEKGNQAFVVSNKLKVMMEEDYLALRQSQGLAVTEPRRK